MRKKRKKDKEEELTEDEFDEFQIYGPPHLKRRKNRKDENPISAKLDSILNMLVSIKKGKKEKDYKQEEWLDLGWVLNHIWICATGDAILAGDDIELQDKFSRIALGAKSCLIMLYSPTFVVENDGILRANLDILFRDMAAVQKYMSPVFISAINQLEDIDIVKALTDHRAEGVKLLPDNEKSEGADKVDMQMALVDICTGELFWSDRYKITEKDRKGFLPIAPFYVGCSEYRTKVEAFACKLKEGEIPLMPGAAENNRDVLRKAIKHLLISFRIACMIAPVTVVTKEGEQEDETRS